MTLLGKIFTVLIFIMSIVFFAFSVVVYATHKNWRIMATNDPQPGGKHQTPGLKQQLDHVRLLNKDARNQIAALQNELAKERAARRQVLAVLQTNLEQKSTQVVQKEELLGKQTSLAQEAAKALEVTQLANAELVKDIAKLRQDIREKENDRDSQLSMVVALTDKLHSLEGEYRRLTDRRDQLVIDVSRYKKATDIRGIKVDDPIDPIVPKITGQITAVGNAKDLLVEISIGADDGLRVNHQLDVYRNSKYLGKIKILKTSPDKSVAQIIKESQRGPIEKGDKVGSSFISVSTN